jgi:hypothetical protein
VNTEALTIKTEPSTTIPANTYKEDVNDAMGWLLGYVMGKTNDSGMGLGGFILSGSGVNNNAAWNGTEVNKSSNSSIGLAFVAGGEGKIKEWLSARAGFSTNLWGTNTTVTETGGGGTTTKTTTTTSMAPTSTISTGISLIFGDVTIDGVLNQDVLYTGTYFVSGVPAGLNSQVSATWGWGGSKE